MRRFLILGLLVGCGCSTRVIAPPRPVDPVTVYLTDYGRHSSIVMPQGPRSYVEYAFGEWNFFARGDTRWWVGARALLGSSQSTLGRRQFTGIEGAKRLKDSLGCTRMMPFEVSRLRAELLALNLDADFRRSAAAPMFSSYSQLHHVRDDTFYWLGHNCNHITAQWLKQLGCRIDGPAVFSNFRVVGSQTE